MLQAGHPNFLHGHWAHRAGVAHYGTWVTSHEGPASEDSFVGAWDCGSQLLGSSMCFGLRWHLYDDVWLLLQCSPGGMIRDRSGLGNPFFNTRGLDRALREPCRPRLSGPGEDLQWPATRGSARLPPLHQRRPPRVFRLWRHGGYRLGSAADRRRDVDHHGVPKLEA